VLHNKQNLNGQKQHLKNEPFFWIQTLTICSPYQDVTLSEVDVAAFDPLFYFHHANCDRFYWAWQQKYNEENWHAPSNLPEGNNPNPWKAPEVRLPEGTILSLQTPLHPFGLDSTQVFQTHAFGYTYPTVESPSHPKLVPATKLYSFNKLDHPGQNYLYVFGKESGKLLGAGYAFTRINPHGCKGCAASPWMSVFVPYFSAEGFKGEMLVGYVKMAIRKRIHIKQ